jgi:DUF2934 family protein
LLVKIVVEGKGSNMGQKAKREKTELPAARSQPQASEIPVAPALPHDEIRRRAYEIYLERGGEQGRDLENWLQAERELRAI